MIPFQTSVIGSLPRPTRVLDLLKKHHAGHLSDRQLDSALDREIGFAIGLQEAAGIDVISDGEWRRIGYFEVFAERVGGFRAGDYATEALGPNHAPDAGQAPPQPWTLREFKRSLVVEPMSYTRPIAAEAARFLRAKTQRQIKVALPSPHMIGRRLWHPEYSRGAYPTRRDFIEAVIPILRKEVEALKLVGVDVVQFDDPWFCFFVDPDYRQRFEDPETEMAQAIDDLNRVVEGTQAIKTALHVCRGNRMRRAYARGDYEPILPFLLEAKVDQLAMEFAVSAAGDINVFERHRWDREIGLGVVDVRIPDVEPEGVIMERVERAVEFFAPEQISLNPDCGFAPTSTNPIPLDEAYLKLCALSQAAQTLRERYS
jgi:5-methyltetrahydropteroyltriglutamate--homocysteine methyltransferase